MTKLIYLLAGVLIFTSCQQLAESDAEKTKPGLTLQEEVDYQLTNRLLEVWYPRTIDEEHGGFLTNFTHDWQQMDTHNKMIVSQARHLWTLSKAAAIYPEEPVYVEAARHAYDFLHEKMWDQENGGFYWL